MRTVAKFAAFNKRPLKYYGNNAPKCPHCESICSPTNDLLDEGQHDVLCSHCSREFTVNTQVSYSFDTYEPESA